MLSERDYYRIIEFIERNDKGDGYITVLGLKKFLTKLRKSMNKSKKKDKK